MNNTKLNAKISRMEQAATTLLVRAQEYASQTNRWNAGSEANELLEAARAYTSKVNAVVRHKE